MLEHALEDAAVERYVAVGIEGKGMRLQNARDIGGNLVGLLFLFFLWRTGSFALIVGVDELTTFFERYLTLDVTPCHFEKIRRRLQTVHSLQSDGSLPVGSTLLF